MILPEAVQYVGGGTLTEWEQSSRIQFGVLLGFGLTSQSSVLEVGAGCLGLGRHLVRFLDPGNYTAIEPNPELVAAVEPLDGDKSPLVLQRTDFDPAEAGRTFDIVYAHSVLTHAAPWQSSLFLRNVRPHLRPGALVVASLRWGQDTNAGAWTYPGAVCYSPETVERIAREEGFRVKDWPDIRQVCEARLPRLFHDWAVFEPL